jgi:hypothetical protein
MNVNNNNKHCEFSFSFYFQNANLSFSLFRHQLEIPGKYSQLTAFYEDKRGMLPTSISIDSIRFASPASTPSSEILPELKVSSCSIGQDCWSAYIFFNQIHNFLVKINTFFAEWWSGRRVPTGRGGTLIGGVCLPLLCQTATSHRLDES